MRRPWRILSVCCAVAGQFAFGAPARAQGSPVAKPITFMVAFAAGGSIDTIARIVAQELSTRWQAQVTVENRAGAGGNLAARAVAAAPADGSTVLVTGTSVVINQVLYKTPGYSLDALTAIALPVIDATAITVNAANPAKTLGEFLARSNTFNFGAGGSSARIVGEYLFKVAAKTNATFVPFQGGAQAVNALLGGHIDVMSGPVSEVAAQAKENRIRVLAVSGSKRAAILPDVPTLRESGFEGLDLVGDIGLFVPAKTPKDTAHRYNQAINDILQDARIQQRLEAIGYETNRRSLPELSEQLARSRARWSEMIQSAGIELVQ
jgi:tripartite-type tricarboxylate transporter receptor subunit TctC